MKDLRVTKIVKEIKFEGLSQVRSKKVFPVTIIHKIFETNSSFHVNFCFSRVFSSINKALDFDGGTGHWGIILWDLDTFLMFPKFF